MKILVIHHVEQQWLGDYEHEFYRRNSTLRKVIDHVRRAKYDKIIISMAFEYQTGYPELDNLYPAERVNWWYGDNPDYIESDLEIIHNDNANYPGHEWLFVYEWIKDLKGHQVSVCGGHEQECLLGLQTTLDHVGVKYKTIERCVYGDLD